MGQVLCRVTAKFSAELWSSESWFKSQKFGRLDDSPIDARMSVVRVACNEKALRQAGN
jgi:hypothetical protein